MSRCGVCLTDLSLMDPAYRVETTGGAAICASHVTSGTWSAAENRALCDLLHRHVVSALSPEFSERRPA